MCADFPIFHDVSLRSIQLPNIHKISHTFYGTSLNTDVPSTMAPTYKGANIPTSYATCSIGHKEEHDLPSKLEAISSAGFEAVELSMPDILSYAQKLNGKEPDPKDFDTLVSVGQEIKKLVQKHNLKILMLQPFANFEGWIKGKHDRQRADAWERAKGWMRIMEAVGTDMLQVCIDLE